MNLRFIALMLASITLVGCGGSGVLQVSPDTYLISRTSAAGAFASKAGMMKSVIEEANEFSASKGKITIPISSSFTRPVTGFPTFEYQFRVVDKDDVEAQRTALLPTAPVQRIQIDTNIKKSTKTNQEKDIYKELLKLGDLLNKKLLTKDEYEIEKKKLLNQNY
jgi:hypothetical protein